MPIAQYRRHHVVAVCEHLREYLDGLADGALDRETARVDLGPDALDDGAAGMRLVDFGGRRTTNDDCLAGPRHD